MASYGEIAMLIFAFGPLIAFVAFMIALAFAKDPEQPVGEGANRRVATLQIVAIGTNAQATSNVVALGANHHAEFWPDEEALEHRRLVQAKWDARKVRMKLERETAPALGASKRQGRL